MKRTSWCAPAVLAVAVWFVGAATVLGAEKAEKDGRHVAAAASHESAAEAEHGAASGHGSGSPNPLAVDPDLAIWTAVIFVVLFLVLRTFAWPQISAALEERERKIADNIAAAQARHEEAKKLLSEHEAKLAAAAGEVRAMLDEARRDAETVRKRIEEDGHKAAKDELDRAIREIGRARDAAVHELAVKSANAVVDLARGVVRDEISAERQKQIVRDAISKLGAGTPSNN
jgi:F-type H+-transporting ATPase subunit b